MDDDALQSSEFPPLPIGSGATQTDLFRSVAARSEVTEDPRSEPLTDSAAPLLRSSLSALPSLHHRLVEAGGEPVRLGRYLVHRFLGAGGMGVVYEATHAE